MTRAASVIAAAAVALACGCSHQNSDKSSDTPNKAVSAKSKISKQPAKTEPAEHTKTMDPNLQSDPSLKPVDGADVSPLPAGALLRYQIIRLGPGCRGNYRFILHDDGRVFMQENGARSDCEPPRRFDADYPDEPMGPLARGKVDDIKALIRKHEFFKLSAGYRRAQRRFDGAMEILDVQLDGQSHRVVLEKVDHPVISTIRDAVLTPLYNP